MAHSKQAQKRVKTDEEKRIHNRTLNSKMKTAIRRVRKSCEEGDAAAAKANLIEAMKRIDKCAKKNIIHENNAARKKSLLCRKVAAVG